MLKIETLPFPEINASLNALAFLILTVGFIAVKRKNIPLHRVCMIAAFLISTLFLTSYLTYHYLKGACNPFYGEGIWHTIYYTLLVSHILLAIVAVPLILCTLFFAFKKNIQRHRSFARWTFPIWYYVSISGVLVYFFLYKWFSLAA